MEDDSSPHDGPNVHQDLAGRLAAFLDANPAADLGKHKDSPAILSPWADESVIIRLGDDSTLVDILNGLILPPELSAIWHRETRDLEVILGPLPSDSEYYSRHFGINFRGADFLCEYGEASMDLIAIARAAVPVGRARRGTNFRNLNLVNLYLHMFQEHPEAAEPEVHLRSFWIRDLRWDPQDVVTLARHINFFMTYFDPATPRIILHEPPSDPTRPPDRLPLPYGTFPNFLAALEIDPYLMGLWESAVETPDIFRKFLHYYQVLEYAAFYHLDSSLLKKVKLILRAPDAASLPDLTARKMLDVMADDRRRDEAKIVALVKEVVDHRAVWSQIEHNITPFSSLIRFDGGFELSPLVKDGWKVGDFAAHWIPTLPDSIRHIRNAMVHGREQRMATAIAPTRANLDRLRPWVPVLAVCAMQAIVYST